VQAQQHGGAGEHRAGVAGGDERVGPAVALERETDDHARLGLPADRLEGLLAHPNDVGRLVDLEAAAIDPGMSGQLGLDGARAADELDQETLRQPRERFHHPRDFGPRSAVPPHRVQRDANHAQASSTSTRFLPP
jgi:hypothetical protein